jgi:hypothetical protein
MAADRYGMTLQAPGFAQLLVALPDGQVPDAGPD